jgi:Carboxypeptidase regulatory-like domain
MIHGFRLTTDVFGCKALVVRLPFRAIGLAALLAASICVAQETQTSTTQAERISSGLELRVVDPSGAVVPKARVIIKSGEKEQLANGLTDGRGRFSIAQVPPGAYDITVRLAGFKTLTKTVLLQQHQVAELNLALQVDPVSDSIHHGELALAVVVEDENGAVIPSASVSITREETDATFNGRTNQEGAYRAMGLAAGNYTLTVERLGFKAHNTRVTIREHEAHTITITLVVATIIDQIRVPGSE